MIPSHRLFWHPIQSSASWLLFWRTGSSFEWLRLTRFRFRSFHPIQLCFPWAGLCHFQVFDWSLAYVERVHRIQHFPFLLTSTPYLSWRAQNRNGEQWVINEITLKLTWWDSQRCRVLSLWPRSLVFCLHIRKKPDWMSTQKEDELQLLLTGDLVVKFDVFDVVDIIDDSFLLGFGVGVARILGLFALSFLGRHLCF